MIAFHVNGKEYESQGNIKLLTFLRERLGLTSVKEGCGEGACGACMVLIDGVPTKSCEQFVSQLAGRHIVTVDGFSEREKEVYSYAFAEAGAVHCGFCTPAMLISAKGLIDKNPAPTPSDVKNAIKNNICRCTGYKKIEQAILNAARIIRDDEILPMGQVRGFLGEKMPRIDAVEKALGTAKYADDYSFDGMLVGGVLRSRFPRARIISIDVDEARKVSGVAAILTAADIPGAKKIGHIKQDWNVLVGVGKITHYVGDSLALIAAENYEALEKAKALIKVEYEELPAVFSPNDALCDDATLVHENGNVLCEERLVRGNADYEIAHSKYVVTNHYSFPHTQYAFLESECAVALIEDGTVHIYSDDQGILQTRNECAAILNLPPEQVRVTAAKGGGWFDGKADMSAQHHAALLAYATQQPVKVKLTRAESILVHPKYNAMEIDFTAACDEKGRLTAAKARITVDAGAYASFGRSVLQCACTNAAGPYNYQDIDIVGRVVYTNNPPAGAFQGFGVAQSCFAEECNLNELAEKVGISPLEIRYINAIRPGQILPNGQTADERTAFAETLDAVKNDYLRNPKCAIACAMKSNGLGNGTPDTGRCVLAVENGKIHIRSSAACVGQEMASVIVQMVCEAANLSPDILVYDTPDTIYCPDVSNTIASRQTVFSGEAAVRAAKLFKAALLSVKGNMSELEGLSFAGEYMGVTDPMSSDKENPTRYVTYSYATHLVELDDNGLVKRVTAAHDVGCTVNPVSLEGQIEGGIVRGLGYALGEDFPLENGKSAASFGTLGLFKSTMTPEIVVKICGKGRGKIAYGAKDIDEIAAIPTAPAAALAYKMFDGEKRVKLPLNNTPYINTIF